jgi:hypothetical protein
VFSYPVELEYIAFDPTAVLKDPVELLCRDCEPIPVFSFPVVFGKTWLPMAILSVAAVRYFNALVPIARLFSPFVTFRSAF